MTHGCNDTGSFVRPLYICIESPPIFPNRREIYVLLEIAGIAIECHQHQFIVPTDVLYSYLRIENAPGESIPELLSGGAIPYDEVTAGVIIVIVIIIAEATMEDCLKPDRMARAFDFAHQERR